MSVKSTMTNLNTKNKNKLECEILPIGENYLFTSIQTFSINSTLIWEGRRDNGHGNVDVSHER